MFRPVKDKPAEDRALATKLDQGEGAGIEALFERFWEPSYRAAYLIVQSRAAAEDIAQDTLLTVIGKIATFDRSMDLKPWIHRIAVNKSLDWLRSESRLTYLVDREAEDSAEAEPGLDQDLLHALGQLPPDQRSVVVLRHLFGYAPNEIAAANKVPPGTVRAQLSRALSSLRDSLEEECS